MKFQTEYEKIYLIGVNFSKGNIEGFLMKKVK